MPLVVLALTVLLALTGCAAEDASEPFAPKVDRFDAERAMRDVRAQAAIGPRHSGSTGGIEEVELITRRLRAISGVEGIAVQAPWQNVVARIPGSGEGSIVVGAHHDTKDDIPSPFEGANDGASGVAVVLELARALAIDAPIRGSSIEFAFFDGEEARGDRPFTLDGARGSRQYLAQAVAGGGDGTPPVGDLRAMVLFDLVGDCELQLPREENSDAALYDAFAEAAVEVGGSAGPFTGVAPGVQDDHIPFAQAAIPAVDVIDFAFGPGEPPGEYWHTEHDTFDKVCSESLDVVGETAVVALPRLP